MPPGEGDNGRGGFNGAGIRDVNMAPIVSNHTAWQCVSADGSWPCLLAASWQQESPARRRPPDRSGQAARAPHKLNDNTDFAINANFFSWNSIIY